MGGAVGKTENLNFLAYRLPLIGLLAYLCYNKRIKKQKMAEQKINNITVPSQETNTLRPSLEEKTSSEISETQEESIQKIKDLLSGVSKTEYQGNGIWKLTVREHFSDRRLPEGYAYKGGAARFLLRKSLGLKAKKPRDIDIIRTEDKPYENADNEISEEFMPDDYAHGYGVEVIDDISEYFDTRDLTINEVYSTDEIIFTTTQCLLDTTKGILRVTDFEKESYEGVGPKMIAKMLRLAADELDLIDFIHNFSSEDEDFSVSLFWLALNLDRSWERGVSVTNNYFDLLKILGYIPDHIETPEEAADYLGYDLENFDFHNMPTEEPSINDYGEYGTIEESSIKKTERRNKRRRKQ